jgi:hypothetical protein
MIETIYKVTCDHCKERSQQNKITIITDFVKIIGKIGWARIDGEWWCPFCVRPVHALCPPKPRKAPAKKVGKLSKTAREALAQRMIDEEDNIEGN